MKKISVYVDFDGTITKKDIGDEIFKVFGQFEPYHTQLRNSEIDIINYWHTLCKSLKYNDKEELRNFALSCETDAYFKTFADYCINNNINISVVSDGFDVYINPILEKIGLSNINVLCNKLIFKDDNKAEPFFPLATESCSCPVASCKRNAILTTSDLDDIIVFIGDGFSDFCAAEHSDIIFAKLDLARYCNDKRLPHYPYSNFFDVYRIFRSFFENGKIKHRNKALLNRKKAFEIE